MYYFNCWAYLQKILKHVKKRQNFIPILKPLRVSYSPKYLKRTKGPVKDHLKGFFILYINFFFPKKVCIENKETFQRMYHKPLPHQLFFYGNRACDIYIGLKSLYKNVIGFVFIEKLLFIHLFYIVFRRKKTKEIHFYIEIK